MEVLLTIVLGGVIGWLASLVMRRDAQQGILLNIVVGIVGAFLGNWIASLFGSRASVSGFDLVALFWAFVGACALLAIVNLITRRSVR